ncbi:MAG: 4Fe-4S binding protein, partial [Phycisphaerales bacterium]|nr:4Fe-4S binding protein [Phycisphaerales bacterium]
MPRWTVARRTTAILFLVIFVLGARGVITFEGDPIVVGSLTAATWFGVLPLFDPLAASEIALATRSLTTEMLIGAGILSGVALLLGPIFCSWICPLGLLLDLVQSVRARALSTMKRRRTNIATTPSWP